MGALVHAPPSAKSSALEREKPFAGLRIAVSVHLEAKTATLPLFCPRAGAEVFLTGSNPLSNAGRRAAARLAGIETFGVHGTDEEGYKRLLSETLKCRPHIIIDDGGDLVELLCGECAGYSDRLIGGCEETTTGILRLKAREREGLLLPAPWSP